jgi:cold shock CspA family protein
MTDIKVIGRVIKVSKAGWGFISSKDIEFTRIFFHWTALRQDTVTFPNLRTGMIVEFTPLQIPGKGYRAVHVRVIEKPVTELKEAENGTEETNLPTLSE